MNTVRFILNSSFWVWFQLWLDIWWIYDHTFRQPFARGRQGCPATNWSPRVLSLKRHLGSKHELILSFIIHMVLGQWFNVIYLPFFMGLHIYILHMILVISPTIWGFRVCLKIGYTRYPCVPISSIWTMMMKIQWIWVVSPYLLRQTDWLVGILGVDVVGNIKWMELVGKWMRWKNLYGFFLMIDVPWSMWDFYGCVGHVTDPGIFQHAVAVAASLDGPPKKGNS